MKLYVIYCLKIDDDGSVMCRILAVVDTNARAESYIGNLKKYGNDKTIIHYGMAEKELNNEDEVFKLILINAWNKGS